MERKSRSRKGRGQEPEFEAFDPVGEEFEDFDVMEGEPAEDEAVTAEILGGLAPEPSIRR